MDHTQAETAVTDGSVTSPLQLAARLDALRDRDGGPWRIEREKHPYKDGTTHFTHVVYTAHDAEGAEMTVRIGDYLTPELAETLCLLHNNLDVIINALQSVDRTIDRPSST